MTTIVNIKKVVQLANGSYIKKAWQYSNRKLNYDETYDITQAEDFTINENSYKTFLKKHGAKLLNIRVTVDIDVPENLPLPTNCLIIKVV